MPDGWGRLVWRLLRRSAAQVDRSLAGARQRLHLPPPSPVFGTFITFINLAIQSLFTHLDSAESNHR
ncbi:hypothetical protein EMIT0324P_40115 [Pseudomonas chlororaphis]